MKKAFPFICAGVGAGISAAIVFKVPQIVTWAFVISSVIACYLVGNNNNPIK